MPQMSLLEIVVNQHKDQISKNINTDMTPVLNPRSQLNV